MPEPVEAMEADSYLRIKDLSTFTKDWTIKARVSMKGACRPTKAANGFVMKIEIVDTYGTPIECTFFNDAATHWDTQIVQNQVYLFSTGSVKIANKKFTTVNNDYCINFGKHAKIIPAKDDGSISNQAFQFVKIADIDDSNLKSVDVLGVITEVGESSEIKLKSGESKSKRTIKLVDQSNC